MLTDTGPLVAMLDRGDPYHVSCLATLQRMPGQPLITTWACFTEAMYLLARVNGFATQSGLWKLRTDGRLLLIDMSAEEVNLAAEMMAKYADRPMDLADACLVAVAWHRQIHRVFSLDSDFFIYRLPDGTTLEVVR